MRKGIGTDCVEKFTRRECSDGKEERVKILKRIMRTKVKDAEVNVEGAKKEFRKKMNYLERRWGQNVAILARMKEVMQMEVRRTWEEGRTKLKKKVDFLERKWKRVRQDLDPNVKEWRGIRYGDRYLRRKRAAAGRDLNDVPLVYGDAQLTEAQKAVLALPSKFCTFETVTEHKMAVAASVMGSKIAWELHARKDRKEDRELDGEMDGEGEWREEEEVNRQEEKNIFGMEARSISPRDM